MPTGVHGPENVSDSTDGWGREAGVAPGQTTKTGSGRRHDQAMRDHVRVTLLAVKLLLAPTFVVGASLAARRLGPRLGGLIGGLPVVAGPILLAYALEHGRTFAAGAAAGTLLGLVSLIAFVVVYARLAGRVFWGASMLGGWLAFAGATAVFSVLALPLLAALGLVAATLALGLAALPHPVGDDTREHAAPPAWDLPLRAACAAVLVLSLTAIAGWLGPRLSGLLAPFPVIATVLATFTHAQRGTDELRRLLYGLLSGFGAYALFCCVLAVALRQLDTAAAFALATALALCTQGLVSASVRTRPVTAPRSRAMLE
jgi:hypothetical protein